MTAEELVKASIELDGMRVFESYSYALAGALSAVCKDKWLDHGFGRDKKLYYYKGPGWVVVLEEKNSNG
jgi:hypothetical protein